MKKRIDLIRILVLLLIVACSSLPPVFQSDPVGASLYAMKSCYEGTVRSAGQAYLAGQINDDDLADFLAKAKSFYGTYLLAVNLYEAGQLTDPAQIEALRKALDELQLSIQGMILKRNSIRA